MNALQRDLQRTHAIYGICCLSDDSFLTPAQAIVRTFLAMNTSQRELRCA
jgi:hypothetical protein